MYRTIKELNNNELNELRENLYFQFIDEGRAKNDIDDSTLFEYYNGINFVDDDFFCNQ